MFSQVILLLSPLGKEHAKSQLFHTKIVLEGNIKGRGMIFLLRQHTTLYLPLPDQFHRKYHFCLDIPRQNGTFFHYIFFWSMRLRQSQSLGGLFLWRGKKNGTNQIMWKTQCLYHTLPSAMPKQPIHHQCISKYNHSWTNTEENKGMQGIARHPDSLSCGQECCEKEPQGWWRAWKGKSWGEPAAPEWAASASPTDLWQEGASLSQAAVLFLSLSPISVCACDLASN